MLKHLFGYLVSSSGKNEIILMQAIDGVAPPGDRGFPILGGDHGVVACLFGHFANALSKVQSANEITKRIASCQLHDAIVIDNPPLGRAFNWLSHSLWVIGFALPLQGSHDCWASDVMDGLLNINNEWLILSG